MDKENKDFIDLVDSMHEERVINEIQEGTHLNNWNDWLQTRVKDIDNPKLFTEYSYMVLEGLRKNFQIYYNHLKSKKQR